MPHVHRLQVARLFAERAAGTFPEVREVILFGSAARGDDREDSDLDILVLWDGQPDAGRRGLVRLAVDLMLETGEYVSVKVLDQELFAAAERARHPFAEAVRAEGRALA